VSAADFRARKAARRAYRCRHFTGIPLGADDLGTCSAGISYEAVRDASQRPYRWPCVESCAVACASYAPNTPEEIAAEEADIQAAIAEAGRRYTEGRCIHCAAEVTARKVVGKCEYAEPCGHRQGQVSRG
jgi:hypothetical protein